MRPNGSGGTKNGCPSNVRHGAHSAVKPRKRTLTTGAVQGSGDVVLLKLTLTLHSLRRVVEWSAQIVFLTGVPLNMGRPVVELWLSPVQKIAHSTLGLTLAPWTVPS